MWRASVAIGILLVSTWLPSQAEPPFPLIGLWRATAGTWPDGRDFKSQQGDLELEFVPGNVIVETRALPNGEPVSTRFSYMFLPPDKISYTYRRPDKVVTQQERFRLQGDNLTFENLDSGIITRMRRIQHSEFKPSSQVRDATVR